MLGLRVLAVLLTYVLSTDIAMPQDYGVRKYCPDRAWQAGGFGDSTRAYVRSIDCTAQDTDPRSCGAIYRFNLADLVDPSGRKLGEGRQICSVRLSMDSLNNEQVAIDAASRTVFSLYAAAQVGACINYQCARGWVHIRVFLCLIDERLNEAQLTAVDCKLPSVETYTPMEDTNFYEDVKTMRRVKINP